MGVKVRQKGDKWYVFINHQGQRKAECIGSDKRVAMQVQKQLEAKLALGDVGLLKEEPEGVLFRDYAEQWLGTYVTVACQPSTGRIVRSIVRNHLLPAFGTLALRSMTRTHVKTFVAQKQQSLSAGHVRNLVRTLHTICAQAVAEEVMDRNPASRLGKYLPEKRFDPDKIIDPFTSAELERYLVTIPPVVFCTDAGRPWDSKRVYLLHKRVCAMAGLRVTRVHDLRHSYATIQLYELHAPIQYVSEQLGHASIKITIDIYGHPRQGTNTYLADRLDRGGELTQ